MTLTQKYYALVPQGTEVARFDAMPIGHRYVSITAEQDIEDDPYIVRSFIVGADCHAAFEQGWNIDSGGTPTVAGWNRAAQPTMIQYQLSTTDRISDGNGGMYARILFETIL
jgi:hypothetical protein